MGIELTVFEMYLLSFVVIILVVAVLLFTWWLREKVK